MAKGIRQRARATVRKYVERQFLSDIVQDANDRAQAAARREVEQLRLAFIEPTDPDPFLTSFAEGGRTSRELSPTQLQEIQRQSNFLYESHGAAELIVNRCETFAIEKGVDVELTFDEGYPPDVADRLRKRMNETWYGPSAQLQRRIRALFLEAMISGEHGFRLRKLEDGHVEFGDLYASDIEAVAVDRFDSFKIRAIVVRPSAMDVGERSKKDRTLPYLNINPETRMLEGAVVLYRNSARAGRSRGKPVLQTIIDELSDDKTFRSSAMQKMLDSITTMMQVTLKDKQDHEVEAYAKTAPQTVPELNGQIRYTNDKVEYDFKTPDMKGYEIANAVKSNLTFILGTKGYPLSWFSYGDGTNRATADAQAFPVFADFEKQQADLLFFCNNIAQYIIDAAFSSGYAAERGGTFNATLVDEEGKIITKTPRLRDGVHVTVKPKQLTKQKDETPYVATTRAVEILTKLVVLAAEQGTELFSPQDTLAFVNSALQQDGIGIVLKPSANEEKK